MPLVQLQFFTSQICLFTLFLTIKFLLIFFDFTVIEQYTIRDSNYLYFTGHDLYLIKMFLATHLQENYFHKINVHEYIYL